MKLERNGHPQSGVCILAAREAAIHRERVRGREIATRTERWIATPRQRERATDKDRQRQTEASKVARPSAFRDPQLDKFM